MLQVEIKNDMIKAWKSGDMLTKNVLNLLLGKIKNKAILELFRKEFVCYDIEVKLKFYW